MICRVRRAKRGIVDLVAAEETVVRRVNQEKKALQESQYVIPCFFLQLSSHLRLRVSNNFACNRVNQGLRVSLDQGETEEILGGR